MAVLKHSPFRQQLTTSLHEYVGLQPMRVIKYVTKTASARMLLDQLLGYNRGECSPIIWRAERVPERLFEDGWELFSVFRSGLSWLKRGASADVSTPLCH